MCGVNSRIRKRRYSIGGGAVALAGVLWIVSLAVSHKRVVATDRVSENPEVRNAVALQAAFVDVAKQAEESVVNIQVESKSKRRNNASPGFPFGNSPFDEFFRQFETPQRQPNADGGQGSGFVISKDGYILTNFHVVQDAKKVKVVMLDKKSFDGQVVGADPRLDLAVVKIKTDDLRPAELGNSDRINVGEWAIAVGNPFGLDHTLTVGVISAKGRDLDSISGRTTAQDFIQTDAAINPGNSGGPLLNIYGEVVGINNAIFSTSGGNNGIGFAIPINNAKAVLKQLIEDGKVVRGWLGISIQELTPEMANTFGIPLNTKGVLVGEVLDEGPAATAGIETGDVILRYGDNKTQTPRELQKIVAATSVGNTVVVTILRGGKERKLDVNIGEMPTQTGEDGPESGQPSTQTWRGLSVRPLDNEIAEQLGQKDTRGALVIGVEPGSPADDAGISRGDVVRKVGNVEVENVRQFLSLVGKAKDTDPVRLWVSRQGRNQFVVVGPAKTD